jgi:hypothetical protein
VENGLRSDELCQAKEESVKFGSSNGPISETVVNYRRLESLIDLNDPESGFEFATDGDGINLWLLDWRNRRVTLRFRMVYWFTYRLAEGFHGLPEGEALEIIDSDTLKLMKIDGTASQEEKLHHYVISTNEGEWCEVVSETIDVKADDLDAG